ncbi:hypothetical protein BH11ACT7_BH11ACT7_05120 [soil metagenome]
MKRTHSTAVAILAAAGTTAVLIGLLLGVIAIADEAHRTVTVVNPSESGFPTEIWTSTKKVTTLVLTPRTAPPAPVTLPGTFTTEAAPTVAISGRANGHNRHVHIFSRNRRF